MRNLVMGCAVAGLIALSPKTEAKLPDLPVLFPTVRCQIPKIHQAISKGEVGMASWYGSEFQGRTTASGELYDPHGLTAAHRKLPFGTKVRVTNLKTLESVLLRITDRGPGTGGRVIDVSWGAAQELGFLEAGLARVKIEVVSYPEGYIRASSGSRSPKVH
jgi:rare lipoprotein A